MSRITYIILLLTPFIIFGAIFKEKFATVAFPWLAGVYIPIITITRMKLLGMTWKDVLKATLGFSFKDKTRVFWDK